MTLVTFDQESLIGGVSQQPAGLAPKGTCRRQDDYWGSLLDGLSKRAPTDHVARLVPTNSIGGVPGSSDPPMAGEVFVHGIDKGPGEKYILCMSTGIPFVYDAQTGERYKVAFQAGTSDFAYLKATETQKIALKTPEGLYSRITPSVANLPGHATTSQAPDLAVTADTAFSWKTWRTVGAAATYGYEFGVSTTTTSGPYLAKTEYNGLQLTKTASGASDSMMFYYEFAQSDEYKTNGGYNLYPAVSMWRGFSIYVKQKTAGGVPKFDIGIYNATTSAGVYGDANWSSRVRFAWSGLSSGATLSFDSLQNGDAANTVYGSEDIGYGWYRVWVFHKSTFAESTQENRCAIYYDGAASSASAAWDMDVSGAIIEDISLPSSVSTPTPNDFWMKPTKAYRAVTIQDYTFLLNTTVTTEMDSATSPTFASYAGGFTRWTITVTGNISGILADVGKQTFTISGGSQPTLTFQNGTATNYAPPMYTWDASAGATAALDAAQIQLALTSALGIAVGISGATLSFVLPSTLTVTETNDVGGLLTITQGSSGSFADEVLFDVKNSNYFASFWTGLASSTYSGRAAVAVTTASNGTAAGGAICVNGSGATLATCTGSNHNRGVFVPSASRLTQIGNQDVAVGLRDALSAMFAAVPPAQANTYYTFDSAASGVPWATAQGLYLEASGPTLRLAGSAAFSEVDVMDSLDGASLIAAHGEVRRFADLPQHAPDGCVLKVKGNSESELDDYYVKFEADQSGGFTDGKWREAVNYGMALRFKKTTMPHQLVRRTDDGAGTVTGKPYGYYFEYGPALIVNPLSPDYNKSWIDRAAGDDSSNPKPSFVGNKITDIFFFQGRLGLLSGQNVILSEVNRYFSFWRTTVVRYIDGDPIDINLNLLHGFPLRHALQFGERLLVFHKKGILSVVPSREGLTPQTVDRQQLLARDSLEFCRPALLSRSVLVAYDRGDFSGIYENFPSEEAASLFGQDLTVQVPAYIAGDAIQISASSHENVVVVSGSTDRNRLYICKMDESGGERVQSAWWRYSLGTAATILGHVFIDNVLYIVVRRSYGVHLEKMLFQSRGVDAGSGFTIAVDRRITSESPHYRLTGTNPTTITLPYRVDAGATPLVINGATGGIYAITSSGTSMVNGHTVTTLVVAAGLSGIPIVCGQYFASEYETLPPYRRESARRGQSPDLSGRTEMARVKACVENTNNLSIYTQVRDQSVRIFDYTETTKYADQRVEGPPVLISGKLPADLGGMAEEVRVLLVHQSHLPVSVTKLEWEADVMMEGARGE